MTHSLAGKLQIVVDLLDNAVYDDEGKVVGYTVPMITPREAIDLLNFAFSDLNLDKKVETK